MRDGKRKRTGGPRNAAPHTTTDRATPPPTQPGAAQRRGNEELPTPAEPEQAPEPPARTWGRGDWDSVR